MKNDFTEKIISAENNFPRLFSNVLYKDYGVLFFNEKINISYDSNHAIINHDIPRDFNRTLDEITEFYEERNIAPRIYSSLYSGQLIRMENILLKKHFIITRHTNCWLVKKSECLVDEPYSLKIERVINDNDILRMAGFYDNEWEFPLLKKKIKNTDYIFFAGFINDIPVSVGAIQYIDGTGRVDDVETKSAYRGNGYGGQIIRRLVKYHEETGNGEILYLWYNNPIAGKIYNKAGFVEFENNFETWSACKNRT